MAAFPARGEEAFLLHWRKLLADSSCIACAVVMNERVTGHIGSWTQDGQRLVGYWIESTSGGKGLAKGLMSPLQRSWGRSQTRRLAEAAGGGERAAKNVGFGTEPPPRTSLWHGFLPPSTSLGDVISDCQSRELRDFGSSLVCRRADSGRSPRDACGAIQSIFLYPKQNHKRRREQQGKRHQQMIWPNNPAHTIPTSVIAIPHPNIRS